MAAWSFSSPAALWARPGPGPVGPVTKLSNHAITERLVIAEHTVEKHVKSILATLRLPTTPDHRRVLAVLTYLDAR